MYLLSKIEADTLLQVLPTATLTPISDSKAKWDHQKSFVFVMCGYAIWRGSSRKLGEAMLLQPNIPLQDRHTACSEVSTTAHNESYSKVSTWGCLLGQDWLPSSSCFSVSVNPWTPLLSTPWPQNGPVTSVRPSFLAPWKGGARWQCTSQLLLPDHCPRHIAGHMERLHFIYVHAQCSLPFPFWQRMLFWYHHARAR